MDGGQKKAKINIFGVEIEIVDSMDRISDLLVGVKEGILEKLTLQEAVCTSVLSSKWRYCWTGRRQLDLSFDYPRPSPCRELTALQYTRIVDTYIRLHQGPVDKFVLCVPKEDGPETSLDVSGWLAFLSEHGIKDIDINTYQWPDFQIPSTLFRCLKLINLQLWSCRLAPPPHDFGGFSKLVSLKLHFVEVQSNILGSVITGCPCLETLLFYTTSSLEQPLHLNSPTLKFFYFEGYCWSGVIFDCVPKLKEVSLLALDKDIIPKALSSYEHMCSLSGIEKLMFDCELLEPMNGLCPRTLGTPLWSLHTLILDHLNVYLREGVSYALCLVRSSPCLEDLTLHLDEYAHLYVDEDDNEITLNWLRSEASDCLNLSNLRTVRIESVEASRHDIKLVQIILSGCPKLETLVIRPRDGINVNAEQHMIREFMKFRRSSNMAELLYGSP